MLLGYSFELRSTLLTLKAGSWCPGYTNETAAVSSIQSYIRDVQNWMLMGKFKLNPDKTEFIIWTRQRLEKVKTSHLIVGESRINSLPK